MGSTCERKSLMAIVRLTLEMNSFKELAARFRRRHHYMCRGPYSVKDLVLITFAADTADSLAQYLEAKIIKHQVAAKVEPLRKRIQEINQECYKNLKEDRWREIIEELEELEFQEMMIMRDETAGINIKSAVCVSHDQNKAKASWKHKFMHLVSYENAGRIDITSGEDQDMKNMRSAFLAGIKH